MKSQPHFRRAKSPVLAPDEYQRRRRERRLERTSQSEAQVRAWTKHQGLALRVLNGGHHWLLERTGLVAEWWPSSAKLAINRDYLRTFHAPHWPDVVAVLQRHLAASPASQPNPSSSACIPESARQ